MTARLMHDDSVCFVHVPSVGETFQRCAKLSDRSEGGGREVVSYLERYRQSKPTKEKEPLQSLCGC